MVVARPSKYGNPFRVVKADGVGYTLEAPDGRHYGRFWSKADAAQAAVRRFRKEVAPALDVEPVRGHDLACWCPLDQACHADVLLEIANA